MTQAHLQALIMEVIILKRDLKRYMSTTELEKQNLEAHVDLCSERYKGLHDRLSAIEVRLGKMNEEMTQGHKSQSKTYVTDSQLRFIKKYSKLTFKNTDLLPEEMELAKTLADKAIFVRKKLDIGVQYALNKRIRLVHNGITK